MFPFEVLGPFLVAVVVICLAPGADMAFVVASALSDGRRAAILAACGISAGVTVWVVATACGLAALLAAAPALQEALQAGGATYLGYLAWQTWKHAGEADGADLGAVAPGGRQMFWRGMVTNLANPKMGLFFTAFLPRFVQPGHGSLVGQLVVLGLLMQAVGLLVDATVGIVAGGARTVVLQRPTVRTGLERAAAVVLATLGLVLAYELATA